MKHKVLIVTGAIGSGKTSLTKVFEEYGFQVDAIYNKKNKKKVFLFVKKDECEKDD